jgi:hypothetical protein
MNFFGWMFGERVSYRIYEHNFYQNNLIAFMGKLGIKRREDQL